MKINRILVRHLPGIDEPFAIDDLRPGVNLVYGPNGSGKSSLCRAILATLWPVEHRIAPLDVESVWIDATGHEWRAVATPGRTAWTRDGIEAEPPRCPEAHVAGCYLLDLRDLMDDAGATSAELARRVRVQLAGGYDVARVRDDDFVVSTRPGRSEEKALREARQSATKIEHALGLLAERDSGRAALERTLDAERERRASRDALDAALDHARKTLERAAVERELRALPEELHRVRGNERERLDELDEALAERRRERNAAHEELTDAEREGARHAWPAGAPDESELDDVRRRLPELQRREAALLRARDRSGAAEDAMRAARARMGPVDPARAADVDDEALRRVETTLRRREHLAERLASLDERIRQDDEDLSRWAAEPSIPKGESLEHRSDALKEGVRWLRRWLREPPPLHRRRSLRISLLLSILVAIAAAVMTLLVDVGIAPFAAFAWGAALTLLAVYVRARLSRRPRERVQQEYSRLGLVAPSRWAPDAVERLLHSLESESLALRRAEAVAARRDDRIAERRDAAAALEDIERERAAVRDELGIATDRGELPLLDLAASLAAYRRAELESASADAERERLESAHGAAMTETGAFLARFEEGDAARPRDVAEVRARLDALDARRQALSRARDDAARARRALETIDGAIASLENKRRGLYAALSLADGDRDGLVLLLSRHEELSRLAQRAATLDERIAERRAELSGHGDLLDLGVEELTERLNDAKESAERFETLLGEIKTIEADVRRERGDERLEEAHARARAAEAALLGTRDDVLVRAAGRFLLDEVEREHSERSRPAVLREAARLFAAFTAHRYELRLATAGESHEFVARDTVTRRSLGLSELSDGTRVQLQLAARVAFTGESETEGLRLPLLLDETLTNSDPERFDAVAEALAGLDRSDARQVVYLSADPIDVKRWQQACTRSGLDAPPMIDLGLARQMGSAADRAGELELPGPQEIPPPGRSAPHEYARTIGVPRLDPFAPADAAHLFYALRDDMPLLHRLIQIGLSRVGPWRSARRLRHTDELVDEQAAQRVDVSVELLDALLDAWRRGRGRPVGLTDLAACPAVSEHFLGRLASLAAELGGDASALVGALHERQDYRAKGFRVGKLLELEQYLRDEGHLDDRPPLEDDDVRLSVLAALRARIRDGVLQEQDARRHVSWLLALLGLRSAGDGGTSPPASDPPPRETPPPRRASRARPPAHPRRD